MQSPVHRSATQRLRLAAQIDRRGPGLCRPARVETRGRRGYARRARPAGRARPSRGRKTRGPGGPCITSGGQALLPASAIILSDGKSARTPGTARTRGSGRRMRHGFAMRGSLYVGGADVTLPKCFCASREHRFGKQAPLSFPKLRFMGRRTTPPLTTGDPVEGQATRAA